MILAGPQPLDAVVAAIALVIGYLVGSIPLTGLVARAAGPRTPRAAGVGDVGVLDVWQAAGPGWGMLALTGDLAKGVIPVAVGVVSWSWGVGWAAGLGALIGACWPALGQRAGGPGVAVLVGVAFALAPPAGVVGVFLGGLVLLAGTVVGRRAWVPALVTGLGAFPVMFVAVQQDLSQLAAITVLYLVAGLRHVTARD